MNTDARQPESSISPHEFYQRCRAGANPDIIDVRTPLEYAEVHVAATRLVPLENLNPRAFLQQRTNPAAPLFLLCRSGVRAAKARDKFHRVGFDRCVIVTGGIEAWIAAGLPVEQGARTVLPLMRQVQIAAGLITATGAALTLGVNRWFAVIPLFTGCGLLFAGLTGFCGMALLLTKCPWNRVATQPDKSCC